MNTMGIGQLIQATGMKQADIADAIRVNVSTVRRWAAGASTPSDEHIDELRKLAIGAAPLHLRGQRKPAAVILAEVPSDALIQELARRSKGGTLRDLQL
jgi:transcriptional regulator with XRE-family HTH domain